MNDLLANLDTGPPVILGLHTVTVLTHLVVNYKLHHKHLLQDGTIHNLTTQSHTISAYNVTLDIQGAPSNNYNNNTTNCTWDCLAI